MSTLTDLPTPSLLLDREIFVENAKRLWDHLSANGVNLRVHVKSCKNIDIARLCMPAPNSPIAVSTLAEAEYFASHGIKDIIYAVGISPNKLERAHALREKGVRLHVMLDSPEMAQLVADYGQRRKHAFDALLEIDCDGHRGGLDPESEDMAHIAGILSAARQNISGVLTHAGAAYDLPNPTSKTYADLAEMERSTVVAAAQKLREMGHECGIVSAGSTPTAIFGENFEGLTEVRAGVFMFNDLVMAALGVCDPEQIALSVLCSVIGTRKKDGAIIVDAGWSALSCDKGLPSKFNTYGYGLVCDLDGNIIPHLRVWETNQEHGIICPRPGYSLPNLPIGSLLRILPVHACATAACFDTLTLIENLNPVASLQRCHGW